jgi:hypothetical protein
MHYHLLLLSLLFLSARVPSAEKSPIIHGDPYHPGPSHNDRSAVGRTGYDSYVPDYPSLSPGSRRKSSPRPRVRNIWPPSRSRSRSVSISPSESRNYRRRHRSRDNTLSRGRRSSSRRRRRTYSRGRRSLSRGVRSSNGGRGSLSRGRRSFSRRRRSRNRRHSYSHSSSRGFRSTSRGRRSRDRSSSRGRSISRTRSIRNGNFIATRPNGKKSRKRSLSRSSIASSIASSRASPPPVQRTKPDPPVVTKATALNDTREETQVNADPKLVQPSPCPPNVASLPNDPDSDPKKTGSTQVQPPSATLDQPKRKLEPESVMATDAPVPPPPLPSPLSMEL